MHVPVLVEETLQNLNLKSGDNIIDATLDGGGHTKHFLEAVAPNGKVLGIEQDPKMIESLKIKIQNKEFNFWNNLTIVHDNFKNIAKIAQKNNFSPDAIFFDLGMSTLHLTESKRGFSFQKPEEILDMRFNPSPNKITAAEILNSYSEKDIARIFKDYGEEKLARVFAKKIFERRKKGRILTVEDFLNATGLKNPKILARIFQSLRIFINDEINNLKLGIEGAFKILNHGGKMAVISYHSLEDREVKVFFLANGKLNLQGKKFKKPIVPSDKEIQLNPSARSAKLRILWKV